MHVFRTTRVKVLRFRTQLFVRAIERPEMDNSNVVDKSIGFLRSMQAIASPENIGCQIFARNPLTDPIVSLAHEIADGDVNTSPITLTLGASKQPHFDIRGTHAYGTLACCSEHNFGAIALILITVVLSLAAICILRSN
jgi:hypothetical protein